MLECPVLCKSLDTHSTSSHGSDVKLSPRPQLSDGKAPSSSKCRANLKPKIRFLFFFPPFLLGIDHLRSGLDRLPSFGFPQAWLVSKAGVMRRTSCVRTGGTNQNLRPGGRRPPRAGEGSAVTLACGGWWICLPHSEVVKTGV